MDQQFIIDNSYFNADRLVPLIRTLQQTPTGSALVELSHSYHVGIRFANNHLMQVVSGRHDGVNGQTTAFFIPELQTLYVPNYDIDNPRDSQFISWCMAHEMAHVISQNYRLGLPIELMAKLSQDNAVDYHLWNETVSHTLQTRLDADHLRKNPVATLLNSTVNQADLMTARLTSMAATTLETDQKTADKIRTALDHGPYSVQGKYHWQASVEYLQQTGQSSKIGSIKNPIPAKKQAYKILALIDTVATTVTQRQAQGKMGTLALDSLLQRFAQQR